MGMLWKRCFGQDKRYWRRTYKVCVHEFGIGPPEHLNSRNRSDHKTRLSHLGTAEYSQDPE